MFLPEKFHFILLQWILFVTQRSSTKAILAVEKLHSIRTNNFAGGFVGLHKGDQ